MRSWIKKSVMAGALVLGAAVALNPVGSVQAKELRIAFGTNKSGLSDGEDQFAASIKARTEGRYTAKIYIGALLSLSETMTGVRDGIADGGFVIPAYYRAEFPQTNLMVDVAVAGSDPVALTGAASEYVLTCKECVKEFLAQNQIPLGLTVIGPYYLMSKHKMTTVADFAGRKVRGFGPFGRWLEAMGAQAVVMSANDVYEGLSQGQIEGNVHTADVIRSLSVGEVTDYLLDLPVGVYLGNALYNLNRDVWNSLSDKDKRAFLLAAGDAHAVSTINYLRDNQRVLDDPKANGVEKVKPEADLLKAMETFREEELKTVAKLNKEKFGIADSEARIARFLELVAKWEKLIETVDNTDVKAVGELYNREVFSKVDPAIFD